MPFGGLTKDKNKKNGSTKTVPEMMLSGPDSPDEIALEYEKLSQKKHLSQKLIHRIRQKFDGLRVIWTFQTGTIECFRES